MKTSLFYLPSVGNRTDIEQGLAGLRPELYSQMLQDLSEQAKLADVPEVCVAADVVEPLGVEHDRGRLPLDPGVRFPTACVRVF